MQAITTEGLAAMLALIGLVIAVSALLSGFVERSNFPQVAVFLLIGAVLGPYGIGALQVGLDSPVLRVVATLSLALVLFTDALTLNVSEVKRQATLAGAILGPGTILAAAVMGLAGYFILGLSGPHAAILAAAIASTDPVLLRGLLRRDDIPREARLALRLESGLNDVVLLPIVLVAMALATSGSEGPAPSAGKLLVQMLILGPGAGVVVALVGIGALETMRRRVGVRRDYESIYSLGVCFAAFAAAEALHGSGFLAAFAAGATISVLDVDLCDCFREYGETTAEMLLMFTFVLMGGSLIWSGLPILTWGIAAFAIVALAARPLILFGTLGPMKIDRHSRKLIAWFGPRGLSTLLLVLVPAFAGLPGAERLFQIASVIVLASVVIHGGSLMTLAKVKDRRPHHRPLTEVRKAAEVGDPSTFSVTAAEVVERITRGEDVRLLDVRSERSYGDSDQALSGAVRLHPQHVARDAERFGIPRDAWAALFCTCPSEETSLRAAEDLRRAGWANSVAVVGGWDALVAAGLPVVPRVGA